MKIMVVCSFMLNYFCIPSYSWLFFSLLQYYYSITVKTLNIGTPRLTTIVVLNIKQFNFYNTGMPQKDVDKSANSVDSDQTAP